jgi:hypothetical protein
MTYGKTWNVHADSPSGLAAGYVGQIAHQLLHGLQGQAHARLSLKEPSIVDALSHCIDTIDRDLGQRLVR